MNFTTGKYHTGPSGTNAWDGKKSVLKAGHTLEKPGPWTLDRELADTIFSEISAAARTKQGKLVIICPTCFSLKGQKTLAFVDVGNSVRGPSCPNCLKVFFTKYPNTLGYRLYIFSAAEADIQYAAAHAPKKVESRLEELRNTAIPLKSLI